MGSRTVTESAGWRRKWVNGVYVMRRCTMPSPRPQPSGLLNTPLPMSYLQWQPVPVGQHGAR